MTAPRLKCVDQSALRELNAQAVASPRLRKNLNLHERLDDSIQRFLQDFEPGTYIRPHRHPDKWELFALLQGAAAVLTFDEQGTVLERVVLNTDSARVVEIPSNTWHALVSLAPRTILLETKPGPYDPTARGEFAAWSPTEGDGKAAEFERKMRTSIPGTALAG